MELVQIAMMILRLREKEMNNTINLEERSELDAARQAILSGAKDFNITVRDPFNLMK
jgi:hypothetical protein